MKGMLSAMVRTKFHCTDLISTLNSIESLGILREVTKRRFYKIVHVKINLLLLSSLDFSFPSVESKKYQVQLSIS